MAVKQRFDPPEGQLALFDFSAYGERELTGSHSDDLEDNSTIKKSGKKSKLCPTWDMSPDQLTAHSLSYKATMQRIFHAYPKAVAP